MRDAAIAHRRGPSFNGTLEGLLTRFQDSTQHHAFWQLLMDQQMSLISNEEAPGTGVSAAEAEDFLKQHESKAKVRSQGAIPGGNGHTYRICFLSRDRDRRQKVR